MNRTLLSFCICYLFFSAFTLQAVPTQPGDIKVLRVEGNVFLQEEGQARRRLVEGDVFGQNNVVSTGANGYCVVVFSNGSSIALKKSSSLNIRKYLQDPFDEEALGTFEDLEADPSESVTDLLLSGGKMAFEVKSLSEKSDYEIYTPAGAAGIRGTGGLVIYIEDQAEQTFEMRVVLTEGTLNVESAFLQEDVGLTPGNTAVIRGSIQNGVFVAETLEVVESSTLDSLEAAEGTGVQAIQESTQTSEESSSDATESVETTEETTTEETTTEETTTTVSDNFFSDGGPGDQAAGTSSTAVIISS